MQTVAFCEIDPYCRAVLRKHWPNVPIYENICELTAAQLRADGIEPDIITAGFPCQDASVGQTQWGKRVGIVGERTGLWRHVARLAADFPRAIIILENVPGLLSAGFGVVLGDLAKGGRDADWHCISASNCALPHRRDRLWVVAYPCGQRLPRHIKGQSLLESAAASLPILSHHVTRAWHSLDGYLDGIRVGDGVSVAMERRRIKPLGNAVVPQIPEVIGRAILESQGRLA